MKVTVKLQDEQNFYLLGELTRGAVFVFKLDYEKTGKIRPDLVCIATKQGFVCLSNGIEGAFNECGREYVYLVDAEVIVNGLVK